MDWVGLIFNVGFLFLGLAIYLVVYNKKLKDSEAEKYQYAVMAASVLVAVIIGGVLRKVLGL